MRWARQIEPLRYQESQRQYVEERENIAQRITELYFDVLLQQVNASVARQNVQANEDLFRIGQERYKLGRLSQSDLLLLELNLLNSRPGAGSGAAGSPERRHRPAELHRPERRGAAAGHSYRGAALPGAHRSGAGAGSPEPARVAGVPAAFAAGRE
ncbi:TolC family protein [Hymenobacter sp. DG25B]|uniref:TolC family protein n=1 Tax=Hymenobacter sp. DG25B TaxID=1385664 RepID=UPI0006625F88|nr:TolC family protein [Hymenobacter sp. DG25B]